MTAQTPAMPRQKRSFTAVSTYVFERIMPDAFVLAIGLTILVSCAAAVFAPHGTLPVILSSWYGGMFGILGFDGAVAGGQPVPGGGGPRLPRHDLMVG